VLRQEFWFKKGLLLVKRLNLIDIDTRWGYRSFELWQGDPTKLSFRANLLIVSVVKGSYIPTPGSVVGTLHRAYGFDLADLSSRRAIDLESALSAWVSPPLTRAPYSRLMCIEIPYGGKGSTSIAEQCFLALPILAARGISLDTIVLPLLGTGSHGLPPQDMVKSILQGSVAALRSVEGLARICFVELDEQRAERLSRAMNESLGRAQIALAKGSIVQTLRSEIQARLDRLEGLAPAAHKLKNELRLALLSEESRSYDVGRAGRLLVEHVAAMILPKQQKSLDLYKQIDQLAQRQVSPWVISYMHLLRTFGNEAVHHMSGDRRPPAMSEGDLLVCYLAIDRVLAFWADWDISEKSA
jgi:hypothetical protein